jgi:hypothetical protein
LNRRRITWLLFLVVLAVGLLVPATAYSAYVARFSGDNAIAVFQSSNPATLTMLTVSAGDGKRQETGSKKVLNSWAEVSIFIYDQATHELLMNASGWKALAPADFVMANRLSAATLKGTIPVTDLVGGEQKDVVLNIKWKGTGALQKGTYSYHTKSPLGWTHYTSTGMSREATATANVSVAGASVFAGSSYWAYMSSSSDFQVNSGKWVYLK